MALEQLSLKKRGNYFFVVIHAEGPNFTLEQKTLFFCILKAVSNLNMLSVACLHFQRHPKFKSDSLLTASLTPSFMQR